MKEDNLTNPKKERIMKSIKMTLLAISIIALIFGMVPSVFATGSPAPGDDCCVVANPGSGALAFKATLSLVYDETNNSNPNLDVTLRLQRSGDLKFFRLNLTGYNLKGLANEAILCMIFNPANTSDPRVDAFVNQIRLDFGLRADTRFAITANSLTDFMGVYDCDSGSGEPGNCIIPGTFRSSTLGDFILYNVQIDRFNPLSPSCQ
jgi:hypothetical protein